jgi:hypothetical protein
MNADDADEDEEETTESTEDTERGREQPFFSSFLSLCPLWLI